MDESDRPAAGGAEPPPNLFPPTEPRRVGRIDVGEGHELHFELCGNPNGLPVLFLHGGPGSGCSAQHRRLLDPLRFNAVLFDQRGCGRSTPRGSLEANDTARLVADIEKLRRHLGIDRWLVSGGSWGSTLALAYCAQHPGSCLGAILRGIFLGGRADIEWFFRGAGALLPDAWARLAAGVPSRRRDDIARWYCETLAGTDRSRAVAALLNWIEWENALGAPGRRLPTPATPSDEQITALLDKYRIQAHYLAHDCFIGEATALAFGAAMKGIPTAILHGRLDFICRPANAWKLREHLPGSRLALIAEAGHSPFDPPMSRALIAAAAHFHAAGRFDDWGDAGDT